MRAPSRLLTATAAALLAGFALAAPASAAPVVKTYKNCTAIHRDYDGGIAKEGVKWDVVHSHGKTTKHAPTGTVKYSTKLYKANKKSDRDDDGIACEKG